MTQTIDLINAIDAGQSLKIHSIFEELINSRLTAAIEQRRTEIADYVFNGQMDESVALDEEFVNEISQHDLGDLIEFMMTEEFRDMDSTIKDSVGEYIKTLV